MSLTDLISQVEFVVDAAGNEKAASLQVAQMFDLQNRNFY